MYKNRPYIFIIFVAVAAVVFSFTRCTSCNDYGEAPHKGEIVYDVTYSEDLRDNKDFGPFLPYTVNAIYDTCNLKIMIKAPLGLASLDIIVGKEDDFCAITFDNAKIILRMEEMLCAEDATIVAQETRIRKYSEKQNIAGHMSERLSIMPNAEDSIDNRIDFFYVPFKDNDFQYDASSFFDKKRNHSAKLPGLMTGLNIKYGDTNIMMVISSYKASDKISPEDFERPAGYIEMSPQDFFTMMELASPPQL